MIKIIECPRDAMQGLKDFIPTVDKIRYINSLLQVGYDTIDFGSFVSPKAIPQMSDTASVLEGLDLNNTNSKLLAIIANPRGAEDACKHEEIHYLGYPFSISETFQLRNTNATIEESMERVFEIKQLCNTHNKELVIYISMGFGNPYGDPWDALLVESWISKLMNLGITIFSLSDTIGVSNPANINYLFSHLHHIYPNIELGAHLHTQAISWYEKVEAAYESGCRRFDSAMLGFGGCPMAKDDLTGNMATENLLQYFHQHNIGLHLNKDAFNVARSIAFEIFKTH